MYRRYTGPGVASNMAVVQIKMVSGWVADKTSLKSLLNDDRVQLRRYDVEKNNDVQLYFDEVSNIELECNYCATPRHRRFSRQHVL